jgi:primosomal protein N' (replication factor Y) (superfamily II helicase)
MPYCKIVLTNSLQTFSYHELGSLSYEIPKDLEEKLAIGSLVLVPFRKSKENGLVIDIYESLEQEETKFKIREVEELVNDRVYSTELIELLKFTADYYSASYSEVVNAILPTQLVKKPKKIIRLLDKEETNCSSVILALKKARKNQLEFNRLKSLVNLESKQLKEELRKLERTNLIEIVFENKSSRKKSSKNFLDRLDSEDLQLELPSLTSEQDSVIKDINHISANLSTSDKFLIHGVTGSGKTEIYMRLIADVLKQGKSSIVLVPEISLAPQLLERLAHRFGADQVLVWHSALSITEKQHSIQELYSDTAKIIVGARSAIFSPVKNLGLIIIDEEHENSYKQDSPAPRYHARKVAEKRAELNSCPLILGSATPNVELYYKAVSSEYSDYHLLKLSKRVFENPLPEVKIIDMREEFNNANKSIFSRLLKFEMQKALERKEQIILFLNKRGSASHVFCRNCGYVYQCEFCDSKSVYHEDLRKMVCHHCSATAEHPKECPECGSSAIKFFGLGTQKLEQETRKHFPEAKIARLDSDVSQIQNNYLKIWQDFRKGDIDILIGTQMIAKGLDLGNLTVVGVIAADSNFSQLDYSADERGFQLLTQVSGRAGRADKKGIVIFQSYQPERPALTFSKNHCYEDFYNEEIKLRKEFSYPPFSKVIRFLISSSEEVKAIQAANQLHKALYETLDSVKDKSILGPSPAVISKIKNKFRYHIILKIAKLALTSELMDKIKQNYKQIKQDLHKEDLSITIDVDNISLY